MSFFKIIIANYNNMPYIKKCLDSILSQTFQDFKIIVVDDQSTDYSDKFCEMYSRKYPDKIIFHQLTAKGYAGACRNYGINLNIPSQYTWIIDSDDWLYDDNVLNTIYQHLTNKNYPRILFVGATTIPYSCHYIPHSLQDILSRFMAPWLKVIKTPYVEQFIENRAKSNDGIAYLKLIDNIDQSQMDFLSNPCYVYNTRSVTSVRNSTTVSNTYQAKWSDIKFIDDLNNTVFKTEISNKLKTQCITQRKNKYGTKLIHAYLNTSTLQEITIAMATQPHRFEHALHTIKKLIPYCTRFCVILNGFNSIPNELKRIKKLQIALADNISIPDLGCNNKMYWLGDYPGYYLTVDDDIEYPENYVGSLVEKLILYNDNAICSYHGHTYNIRNGEIDLLSRQNFYFGTKYDKDVYCLKVGMGVAICNPQKIGVSKEIFLTKPKNFGDDEIMCIWAQQNNIPMIRVSNEKVFIKDIPSLSKTGLFHNKANVIARNKYLQSYKSWKLNMFNNT